MKNLLLENFIASDLPFVLYYKKSSPKYFSNFFKFKHLENLDIIFHLHLEPLPRIFFFPTKFSIQIQIQ